MIKTPLIKTPRRRFLLPLAFFWFAASVWAHAILVRSSPSTNQIIDRRNVSIELDFNSRVDGKRSRLVLIGPDGRRQALDVRQSSQETILAQPGDLGPGGYVLHWQILAEDGHITQGDVPFQVK